MKALEKAEDRERRHLDKITKMREKALERQTDNDMESVRRQWEFRKESLEDQTDLFLSYIARNEKDLRKHMNSVGGAYADFGRNTLSPRADVYSNYFRTSLHKHMKKATNEITHRQDVGGNGYLDNS